jgi:hypothetical protein
MAWGRLASDAMPVFTLTRANAFLLHCLTIIRASVTPHASHAHHQHLICRREPLASVEAGGSYVFDFVATASKPVEP